MIAAGDPEVEVPKWLSSHVPLGIEEPILPSGIFPEVEATGVGPEAFRDAAKFVAAQGEGFVNYASFKEHGGLAEKELDREYLVGYLQWYGSKKQMDSVHGKTWPSKVAVIVKLDKDGNISKVRLVHDLRRSGVNAKVKLCERLVLPRIGDVLEDLLDLLASHPGADIELTVADFKDAFKQLKVGPAERKYLCGKGRRGWFCYKTVLFGVGSGPLLWGRTAAAIMRSTSSMLAVDRVRLECFVDDPLVAVVGMPTFRRKQILKIVLWWSALNASISWGKVSHGTTVDWIGAQIQVLAKVAVVVIRLLRRSSSSSLLRSMAWEIVAL